MTTLASPLPDATAYPVQVHVEPQITQRDRLTTAFRLILAIPHMILIGGPMGVVLSWFSRPQVGHDHVSWGGGGGVIGVVAVVAAMIGWFAIVFTGTYPNGLWDLAAFYLRWRSRAIAYLTLLRDDYPPFGDGPYPVVLDLGRPDAARHRLSVAFRIFLAIPQIIAVWMLTVAWAITTAIAWCAILLTGEYPESLYQFGVSALRWNLRVEAYLLLVTDEYPPFSLS